MPRFRRGAEDGERAMPPPPASFLSPHPLPCSCGARGRGHAACCARSRACKSLCCPCVSSETALRHVHPCVASQPSPEVDVGCCAVSARMLGSRVAGPRTGRARCGPFPRPLSFPHLCLCGCLGGMHVRAEHRLCCVRSWAMKIASTRFVALQIVLYEHGLWCDETCSGGRLPGSGSSKAGCAPCLPPAQLTESVSGWKGRRRALRPVTLQLATVGLRGLFR
jgi:hypothetical protein